jgi:hypothetical protein
MSDAAETDRQRLGRLVRLRRRFLRLSLSEAARRAGVNRATWTGVEQRATDAEDYTYAGVEAALEWKPGSVAAVLRGEEPIEMPGRGRPVTDSPQPDDLIGRWEEETLDEIWSQKVHPELSTAQREDITTQLRIKVAELRAMVDPLRRAG